MKKHLAAILLLIVGALVGTAPAKKLVVGVAQTVIENTLDKNRTKILRFIDEAKRRGCQLVIFPENALYWSEISIEKATMIDIDRAIDNIRQHADRANLYVVFGTAHKPSVNAKFRNKGFVFDPNGKTLISCWKTRDVPEVFDIHDVRCNIVICSDRTYLEHSDLPCLFQGSQIIIDISGGHGGDKYAWYAFYSGVLYARAGAVVLTYDPIGEGERNLQRKSGTRAHDKLQKPREMAQCLGGLMVTDLMQAVSYLSKRTDVDPKRIAACGYSMGSFVLVVTGAIDKRLAACVLVGGGNIDGPNGYWDNSKPMCQGIPYQSLTFLSDRPAAIYALHAMRGPTLVFNGLEDTVVAIPTHGKSFFDDLCDRTARLLGSPEGILEIGFVPYVSHRPFFVTEPVALWLEDHLDFPLWTPETIREMPTTHISQWVKAENVTVDPYYSSEDREGGVQALGVGIPGLLRSQLSVFTGEQWNQQKDRLIYEAWIRKARLNLKDKK